MTPSIAAGHAALSICFTAVFIPHIRRALHTTSGPAPHQGWCRQRSWLYSYTEMAAAIYASRCEQPRLYHRSAFITATRHKMRSAIRMFGRMSLCSRGTRLLGQDGYGLMCRRFSAVKEVRFVESHPVCGILAIED